MDWVYDDGGRSKYFKAENVGDCVCRAIAIATGKDYKEVYDDINRLAKSERTGKRKRGKSSARDGVYKDTSRKLLESYGWVWVPTMQVGQGCTTHLRQSELPSGRLVVKVSKHATAVIDGVLHDTYDCSRGGTRCVYGYFVEKLPNGEQNHTRNATRLREEVENLVTELTEGRITPCEFGNLCEAAADRYNR